MGSLASGLALAALWSLPLAQLEVGSCAETLSESATPTSSVRKEACATLGQGPGCPAVAVEALEASGYVRRLWLLPKSTEAGQRAWAGLRLAAARDPAPVDDADALRLEPGEAIGEDALVPAPSREVPCGPLRPRWVEDAPQIRWRDAVLEVAVRVDPEAEKAAAKAREATRQRVLDERINASKVKERLLRIEVTEDGAVLKPKREGAWIGPFGSTNFFEEAPDDAFAAALRDAGFRKHGEPEPLAPHLEQMLARDPLLERLLRVRGKAAAEPETVATYRLEGSKYRFALVRTDYTELFLELTEPVRSKVWAALHEWPNGVVARGPGALGARPSAARRALLSRDGSDLRTPRGPSDP